MRNKVNYAVKCAKLNYYRKKLHDNLGDPKNTWKVLNDLMGKKFAVTEISELGQYRYVSAIVEASGYHHKNYHHNVISHYVQAASFCG